MKRTHQALSSHTELSDQSFGRRQRCDSGLPARRGRYIDFKHEPSRELTNVVGKRGSPETSSHERTPAKSRHESEYAKAIAFCVGHKDTHNRSLMRNKEPPPKFRHIEDWDIEANSTNRTTLIMSRAEIEIHNTKYLNTFTLRPRRYPRPEANFFTDQSKYLENIGQKSETSAC